MATEKRSPPGFWEAFFTLRENPIAAREWRSLRKSLRDLRLWLGLRIPRDSREWGVPVIAWTALVPYVTWGMMLITRRLDPEFVADLPRLRIDITAGCFLLFCGYSVLMSAVIMASAVTRERERETWDLLRSAALGRHEVLTGLIGGLLGPILAAQAIVGAVWLVTRPHYRALLREIAPVFFSPMQVAEIVIATLFASLALGVVALAFSTVSSRSRVSVALSVTAAVSLPLIIAFWYQMMAERLAGAIEIVGLCCGITGIAYYVAYRRLKEAG